MLIGDNDGDCDSYKFVVMLIRGDSLVLLLSQ